MILAEDPIAHSRVDAFLPLIGNAGSFVFRLYPNPSTSPEFFSMFALKVFMVPLALSTGLIVGRQLIHKFLFQKVLRLKMFVRDKGILYFFSIPNLHGQLIVVPTFPLRLLYWHARESMALTTFAEIIDYLLEHFHWPFACQCTLLFP